MRLDKRYRQLSPDEREALARRLRQEAEVCLLFTKGKPRRLSAAIRQLVVAPRREHSRKPDEAYTMARQMIDGPAVELFSRERRDGWIKMAVGTAVSAIAAVVVGWIKSGGKQ